MMSHIMGVTGNADTRVPTLGDGSLVSYMGVACLEYTLMHKNIPVVDMQVLGNGYIEKLRDVYDIRHLPLGIGVGKDGIDREALNEWWEGRSIPVSRDGLKEALQSIGISTPTRLIEKCFGLSLSDQYWSCPKGSGLLWGDINFFQNDFSEDVGEVLFGHAPADPSNIDLMSPDNTSDGWLRKKWVIVGGKRFLMKGGSGAWKQEPFNEVIAGRICRRLGVPHVVYTIAFDGANPYSLCENFVTLDTELVPAWRILQTQTRPIGRSLHDHFVHCCEALSVPGFKNALNKMLAMDYIIANEDRHWNNFGVVRNADTLEITGFAPIYDSGSSLWYATDTQRIGSPVGCKPFANDHSKQIKLVDDLSWFDPNALDGLFDEIVGILSQSEDVNNKRRAAIATAVASRCGYVLS